jgi:hypothetical protein
MQKRDHFGTAAATFMTMFAAAHLLGCGNPPEVSADSAASSEALAALAACGLDDGTIERGAHLHACDPADAKKTTICHIPPGNPANAHTICVGNSAVPHHVANHGDTVGPCQAETMCPTPPPPPPPPSCKAGDDCGAGGHGGQPDATCPNGQAVCGADPAQCPADFGSCTNGCCVPWAPL